MRNRAALGLLLSSAAGMAVSATAVTLVASAVAQRVPTSDERPWIEATHTPPLLVAPDELVELRFDVHCDGSDTDAPCAASGDLFLREGDSGAFRSVPLERGVAPSGGRSLTTQVPADIARSADGFSYYAVLRSSSGAVATLPGGGSAAPHVSRPLGEAVQVRLGRHAFGHVTAPSLRVAEAAWGDGSRDVGLEQGPTLTPIGATSFDVGVDGKVVVLDTANRRLLSWASPGSVPRATPLDIRGTLADLEVADDGTVYVLETTSELGRVPELRTFAPEGRLRGAVEVAERASQVRAGPAGPVLLQQPSGQWMAAVEHGRALSPEEQRRSGRPGRAHRDGTEVVLLRVADEIRAALVERGTLSRSWRVTSETALAEVQLAEAVRNRLVLVARVYTDREDEFVLLVLGPRGLERRLSIDSADWAETAPLSRFRLVGDDLYRLGSTPEVVFVDRFSLGIR